MCGIVGQFNFNNKAVKETDILNMSKKIQHRGPDDMGTFVHENMGLGHTRLSVIDLSKNGHQPMSDSSKRFWITYNGEIYNFKELRDNLKKDGIIRFFEDFSVQGISNDAKIRLENGKEKELFS